MIIKIDYKFGQSIYLKNDEEQVEYRLNRIFIDQKNLLSLELLAQDGSLIEIAEIHCSKEKDVIKSTGGKTKQLEEDNEDGEES